MLKKMKKIIAMVMAFCLILGQGVLTMAAPEDTSEVKLVNGDKIATNEDQDWIWDVSLSVPGEVEADGTDIVFIMGGSTAENKATIENIKASILAVIDELEASKAPVKLGLVCFGNTDEEEVILPLTKVTRDNIDGIIEQAYDDYKNTYGSLNMEGALLQAEKMLDDDTEVPASRKHMILMSTGYTYFFNSGENNDIESTIVGTHKDGESIMWGQKYFTVGRHNATAVESGMYVPFSKTSHKWTWETYWENVQDWVEADGDTYVYQLKDKFSDFVDGTAVVNGATVNNLTETKIDGIRYGWEIQVPEDLAQVTNAIPYFPGKTFPNPNGTQDQQNAAHALNYERAQYDAWKVYTGMEEKGYNCYSIVTYMKGTKYINDENNMYFGECFMDMLAGGEAVRYSTTEDYFAPIRESIWYSLAEGSTVTDYIGYDEAEGYNFDFVDEADALKLTYAGIEYITEKVETTEGATSTYTFKKEGAEEASFKVDYYYGTGTTDEYFVWTFNQKITSMGFEPATLNYKVDLVTKNEDIGEHNAETNITAYLTPVDSDGEVGEPEYFEKPVVVYENYECKVIVNYYELGTTNKLADSFEMTDRNNEAYDVTDKDAIVIEGYTYVKTEGAALTGTLVEEEYVINVYYAAEEEIEDEDTPLGNLPEDDSKDETPEIEIEDEEVPKAEGPKTGDVQNSLIMITAIAGIAVAGTGFVYRKRTK